MHETLSRVFDMSSQTKQKLRGKRISKIVKIYANLDRVFKPASRLGFSLFKLDELLMSLQKIRLRYIVKKLRLESCAIYTYFAYFFQVTI